MPRTPGDTPPQNNIPQEVNPMDIGNIAVLKALVEEQLISYGSITVENLTTFFGVLRKGSSHLVGEVEIKDKGGLVLVTRHEPSGTVIVSSHLPAFDPGNVSVSPLAERVKEFRHEEAARKNRVIHRRPSTPIKRKGQGRK